MHYPFLDIYRYFAALIVCISHHVLYWNKSVYFEFTSILGVELFFILSGFVLAPQILKLEKNPKKYIKTFLLRRWIRTVPPYIVALICAGILFGYGDALNFLKFLTYTQNIFRDNSLPNFFSVAWSLSVEEWFYIFLPLSILLFTQTKNKYFKLDVLTVCVITILFLNLIRFFYNDDSINWGEDIRRSVLLRIDSLCFGVVAYIIKDKLKKEYVFFFIICTILPLFYFLTEPLLITKSIFAQNIFLPLCSICFSSILIILTHARTPTTLVKQIGSFGANISYSMYLFHIFFIPFTINLFSNLNYSLVVYIISLKLFCWVFFNYFEKPILESRPKYT
ncbi:acyltransferase [Candidatus Pelagibacter sp.]|nr:acyltransferase [Candidatus Pelagibacter sp.]